MPMRESVATKNSSLSSYLALCWEMDKSGKKAQAEEKWLGGISLYQNDPEYWQNLVYYYYKDKKYHRVLEFSRKSEIMGYIPAIRIMAMEAAFALGQYRLCYQIYVNLKKEDQKDLKNSQLLQVAQAAMELGYFSQAEKLLSHLAEKYGAKPLPDLKTMLLGEFGSEEKIKDYMEKMEKLLYKNPACINVPINSVIRYATCLIHYGRCQEAARLLEAYKAQIV